MSNFDRAVTIDSVSFGYRSFYQEVDEQCDSVRDCLEQGKLDEARARLRKIIKSLRE